MRIKSFFARTVDEAMTQARVELGDDALLLNTRKVVTDGQPGGYEVTFGIAPPVASEPTPQEPAVAAAAQPAPQPPEELAGELTRLHARMDEIRNLIERTAKARTQVPELADLYGRLLAADVDPLLSQEIIDKLEDAVAGDSSIQRTARGFRFEDGQLEALTASELRRRLVLNARLENVVALVGPTGAGKTTTLMKLAASDLVDGRPVRLLSLDTARVAPQIQLRYFASDHGLAFATVSSLDRLASIVDEARQKELVLIDTPGYGGNDDRGVETTASSLAACPDLDVHLVVPGYMKSSDLRRCIRRYEAFHPSKLLITKMDETQTFGSVYSGAAWAGLKLSFVANGLTIPDDLRPATLEDFIAMVLDHERTRVQRVA